MHPLRIRGGEPERNRLRQRRVDARKPHTGTCDIRDAEIPFEAVAEVIFRRFRKPHTQVVIPEYCGKAGRSDLSRTCNGGDVEQVAYGGVRCHDMGRATIAEQDRADRLGVAEC